MAGKSVLVVDVGGTTIKLALPASGKAARFKSGHGFTPKDLIEGIRQATDGWSYDCLSIGMPGPIRDNRLQLEPFNLGRGWLGFDFDAHFQQPVKLINDAAMQALGSYEGSKMLFLGLGTGLGAALVVSPVVLSLEFAHLPYQDGLSFEDCVAIRGRDRFGIERWTELVWDVVARLKAAAVADYVVLGGGLSATLTELAPGVRRGGNEHAIEGGVRLWTDDFLIA
ncbi:polyphosphate glucokinase [Arboricoccus pini]|uniref:Polyphosphate glucokinase n=1 Tax=Arboricoccus pini TaxID=1963835 RepID=A0A212QQX8_9PROT|nr:ROK family protein [Arboricoccus pini]SNB61743.1 polyphosphate glucokinase [Arboricoccus pini]